MQYKQLELVEPKLEAFAKPRQIPSIERFPALPCFHTYRYQELNKKSNCGKPSKFYLDR